MYHSGFPGYIGCSEFIILKYSPAANLEHSLYVKFAIRSLTSAKIAINYENPGRCQIRSPTGEQKLRIGGSGTRKVFTEQEGLSVSGVLHRGLRPS